MILIYKYNLHTRRQYKDEPQPCILCMIRIYFVHYRAQQLTLFALTNTRTQFRL